MEKLTLYQHVQIVVSRADANFDRACDEAFQRARGTFRIDEDGYINSIVGIDRSEAALVVEFKHYQRTSSMSGYDHTYIFSAYVSKNEGES